MKSSLCIFLVWLTGAATTLGQSGPYSLNIIPIASVYSFLDNGTDQGTAWREPNFDDSGWAAGPAPLGYGQNDLNTIVSFGPNAADKYRTTYFRHAFVTPVNPPASNLVVRLRRDDGGIVYLNGVEIFRSNMPTGAVTHLTLASTAVSGSGETNYFSSRVLTAALLLPPPQTNVLAAEIHQASAASSDLAFCANLGGNAELPTSLTLSVPAGYSTFANNFVRGNNTLSELLVNPEDQTQVFKWIPASQSYSPSTYDAFLGEWSTNFTLNTGEGAWIYSPVAQFLTSTGQVAIVGYVNRPATGGLRFVGDRVPVASTFEEFTGYLARDGDRVLFYEGTYPSIPSQPSSTHVRTNGAWEPALPLLPPGQGAFLDPVPFSSLFICSSNKTVECTNFLNVEALFDPPTLLPGCCTNVSLTFSTFTNFAGCATYYTRIWEATDCCTNSSCSQTITVVDTTPPVISCATNKTVPCATNWFFDPPYAYDTCCSSNVTVSLIGSNLVSSSACQQVWAGLWQAVDCCTNYSMICTQFVTVGDTLPPTLNCSNLIYSCTGPGGSQVFYPFIVSDNCDPHPTVSYYPASGSMFAVGTWPVIASLTDACGNSNVCNFTVTVLSNCPPVTNCLVLTCPGSNVVAYACGTNGAYVPYQVFATNTCTPTNYYVVCEPPPNSWFTLGNTTVNCSIYEIIGGASNHCSFTVTVLSNCPPPNLTASLSGGGLHLAWGPVFDDFQIETTPTLGVIPPWRPLGGVPIASWSAPGQSNGPTMRKTGIIVSTPTPASETYFRLSSDSRIEMNFATVPQGVFTNMEAAAPTFSFVPLGGGPMQVISIDNQNVLAVDTNGIAIYAPTNRAEWPDLLPGAPNLHEMTIGLRFDINNPQPIELMAYDVVGQLISTQQISGILFSNVTIPSAGYPIGYAVVRCLTGQGCGGLDKVVAVPDTTLQFPPCADLRGYPVGPVPNPWVQPGFTITASNSLGQLESNTYIESGPEGPGYHVEYSAEIKFPNHGCCKKIQIELARTSSFVTVVAYAASGAVLAEHEITSEGNPVTLTFPPTSAPLCRVVVTSPTGQTRILKICCLPTD